MMRVVTGISLMLGLLRNVARVCAFSRLRFMLPFVSPKDTALPNVNRAPTQGID
jgi:hypothetical protein